MATKLVKRVMFFSSLEDAQNFDRQEISCHWTKNMQYVHTNGGQNGNNSNSKFRVEVCAKVDTDCINFDATELSNNNYPKESEVVINENSQVDITSVKIIKQLAYGAQVVFESRKKETACTGERVDEICNNPPHKKTPVYQLTRAFLY